MPPPQPPDLLALGADVPWPDQQAQASVLAAFASAPEAGCLGELAGWLAATQGVAVPRAPQRVRVVHFGGAPPSAVADLAATVAAGVVTVTGADVADAVRAGVAAADREVETGADLLIAACAGDLDPATAVISALSGAEPVALLPRGAAATDPAAWMQRAVRVRDSRRRLVPLRERPAELLAAAASTSLAAACSFVLQAAIRRTPVILDGVAVAAAALVARQVQPRAVRWWTSADTAAGPAGERARGQLGLPGVLGLGIGLGDGTAGLLCVPVLHAAAGLARARAAA